MTETKAKRQTDPTVARIRAVKDAAAKVMAAESAVLRARSRADAARVALNLALDTAASPAERFFLESLTGELQDTPGALTEADLAFVEHRPLAEPPA